MAMLVKCMVLMVMLVMAKGQEDDELPESWWNRFTQDNAGEDPFEKLLRDLNLDIPSELDTDSSASSSSAKEVEDDDDGTETTSTATSTPDAPISFPDVSNESQEVEQVVLDDIGVNCTCSPGGACPGLEVAEAAERCQHRQVCCDPTADYRPKCGRMPVRVRKSKDVGDAAVPWMASLLQRIQEGYILLCGGALIHPQVVVTAARCVAQLQSSRSSLVVRLGDLDLLDTEQTHKFQEIEVRTILIHPDYDELEKFNDIALLFLSNPAIMSAGVDTVCVKPEVIKSPDNGVSHDHGCVVTAYGIKQQEVELEKPLRLREAYQSLIPFLQCQNSLRTFPKDPSFELHPTFFCSRSQFVCDLEHDRAGSPVTCPAVSTNQRAATAEHRLLGLVAWGIGCSDQGKPGVHVYVPYFFSWIDFHVTDYFGYIESYFRFNQV